MPATLRDWRSERYGEGASCVDEGAFQPVYLAQRGHGGSVAFGNDAERFPACNGMPVLLRGRSILGWTTGFGSARDHERFTGPDGGTVQPVYLRSADTEVP